MKLAILSDIHGNGDALRAVLADLDERGGADRILALGDIVLLGPDPAEVVELLMARDAAGVYGNIDRFLLDTDWRTFEPESEKDEADRDLCLWALKQLDERAKVWIRALPFQRELEVGGQRLLLVHGSPRSDRDVIKADTPDDAVREMMAGVQADLILFGHTHEPLDRTVDGVRLTNPGAVGYPQSRAVQFSHKTLKPPSRGRPMQRHDVSGKGFHPQNAPGTGAESIGKLELNSPDPQSEKETARYALLTWERDWRVEFRLVHYDVEKTIARLLAAQRPYRLWVVEMLQRAAHVPLETFE